MNNGDIIEVKEGHRLTEHQHEWVNLSFRIEDAKHKEGNKHLSYTMLQICDCGAYRFKEFLHIEDIENLENKGDAK